jgi:hypothetical protein
MVKKPILRNDLVLLAATAGPLVEQQAEAAAGPGHCQSIGDRGQGM